MNETDRDASASESLTSGTQGMAMAPTTSEGESARPEGRESGADGQGETPTVGTMPRRNHALWETLRVPSDGVSVVTDPALLSEEPAEGDGLFGLLTPVVRRALDLGLTTREPSFHVFVAADPTMMVEEELVRYARRFGRSRKAPNDIVYVHDFDHPEAPQPLVLPAGKGPLLVQWMDELVQSLRAAMPTIVQSEEVQAAQTTLAQELESKNRAVIHQLESTAKTLGFGVRTVKGGVQTFPVLHGKPVSAEQFDVLDESTKKALAEAEGRLTREVAKAAELVRNQGERFEEARGLTLEKAATALIEETMKPLLEKVAEFGDAVTSYLERVHQALVEDWEDLLDDEEDVDGEQESKGRHDHDPELARRLNRFRVNLLVSHAEGAPPPVLYETNPTYPKLFGYLERRARFGALLTDFTRIRPGSLHHASGGILILRAADLMTDPLIWERMKRILRERAVGAEDPLGPLGLYATTLRPVPVPIQVRVVLVGPPEMYTAILEADADFGSLFRIKVEIDPSVPRTPEALVNLDAYLMHMAKERGWGPFDREARARILDLATRLAGDRERIALSLAPLEETAAFATSLALAPEPEEPNSEADDEESEPTFIVTRALIDDAWRDRRERLGASERHIRDITLRGEVALDTQGGRVGVVNGLSVFSTGDVEFGQPMRITAVVALGREGIIDVEREAQLGGSIHTKGVAILRGYLGHMFGQERPLSLRAQIAFEQSYGEIEGDSASSSELFAVLSALADLPVDQGLAVTGSVNQLGEMQAIGGVCAKIEGFFDLCHARGLTGAQGVILPRPNLPHLVLRTDVADAIKARRFHLYAIQTVGQGIELLTGVPAGERDATGRFPASSVFGRVERRIIEIAERLREAEGHRPFDDGNGGDDLETASADGAEFRVR